ncbi:DUF1758 domain-containing protein [Nephila pilipes]|uniref:DUF1758 domain-containing protein n=1 Tax=Nephila pilipes TaxID=299642 RepID=A0A8X6Q2D0_NEPPI|nr:DUF1758 domain-containing protein [Nephila pilipes]
MAHIQKTRSTTGLLDDGSHKSYIEKTLVVELNIQASGKDILSQGLFGGSQTPEEEHGRFNFTLESTNRSYSSQISTFDEDKICAILPRVRDENLNNKLKLRGIVDLSCLILVKRIRRLDRYSVLTFLPGRIDVSKSGISAIETKHGCYQLEDESQLTELKLHIMKEGYFELGCLAYRGIQAVDDQKVLELKCNVHADELYCVQPAGLKNETELLTKRKLLSIINNAYDPVGFTSPTMLLHTLLLQEA